MRLTLLLPTFTIGGIIDIQRKPYIEDKQKILEPLVKDSDFGTVEYDHEVMLGENWQDYEDLPRPIAKHRFSLIYDKIDRNKDDLVTREELRNWIKYVNNRVMMNEIDNRFETIDENKNDKVSWEEYKKVMFSMMDEEHLEHDENESILDERISFREQIIRDERKFKYADANDDGELTHEEFMAFENPERFDHMIPVVVADTFDGKF